MSICPRRGTHLHLRPPALHARRTAHESVALACYDILRCDGRAEEGAHVRHTRSGRGCSSGGGDGGDGLAPRRGLADNGARVREWKGGDGEEERGGAAATHVNGRRRRAWANVSGLFGSGSFRDVALPPPSPMSFSTQASPDCVFVHMVRPCPFKPSPVGPTPPPPVRFPCLHHPTGSRRPCACVRACMLVYYVVRVNACGACARQPAYARACGCVWVWVCSLHPAVCVRVQDKRSLSPRPRVITTPVSTPGSERRGSLCAPRHPSPSSGADTFVPECPLPPPAAAAPCVCTC